MQENTGEGSQETCDGVYNGQHYFSCKATNYAVFVAMDKLTVPQSANAANKLRPTQLLSEKNEIRLGNLVAFYDGNNCKHKGTVRWIGSDDSDAHKGTIIIGIEVVSSICTYLHTLYRCISAIYYYMARSICTYLHTLYRCISAIYYYMAR